MGGDGLEAGFLDVKRRLADHRAGKALVFDFQS
jgi:hypothetical protein